MARKDPSVDLPSNILTLDPTEYSNDELYRMYQRARGVEAEPVGTQIEAMTDPTTSPSITEYDVEEVIRDEFGEEGWTVMKPLLATHATFLLDDVVSSRAIMIEGPSGTGKTVLLKTFGGLHEQFCRRSNITPAALVSAEPSKTKEELENNDLLPQLDGRTLMVRDAQTWFGGSEQHIRSKWRKMARAMDGDGYVRHSATHGKVGYEEDIRFNFIGATTPLDPRAWNVMGNVGQRLLFIEWPEEEYGDDWLASVIEGGERQSVKRGQTAIHEFLRDLWGYHGDVSSVEWAEERPNNEVQDTIQYLANVVAHGRASISGDQAQIEGLKRIGTLLYDLARGHALIHGRTHLELDDVTVCARVALSTMPSKRRSPIRALLDPETEQPLTSSELEDIMGISRPTARDYIDEITTLGLGEMEEVTGRGGSQKAVRVASDFHWPGGLAFPEF